MKTSGDEGLKSRHLPSLGEDTVYIVVVLTAFARLLERLALVIRARRAGMREDRQLDFAYKTGEVTLEARPRAHSVTVRLCISLEECLYRLLDAVVVAPQERARCRIVGACASA